MSSDNQDIRPRMDPKRRRVLLAIVLLGFVVWMGFLFGELRTPPSIPRAGREMRELAARHLSVEASNPLAHTGAVRAPELVGHCHRGTR
jgi:hypothetical protein